MAAPVPRNSSILQDPDHRISPILGDPYIFAILMGTFVAFILLFLCFYWRFLDFVIYLAVLGLLVTVSALLVALVIAATQTVQLNELSQIQRDTKETANKIRSDSITQDRVNRFFRLHGNVDTDFKLFFPVEYVSKPLPVINQGDFYAIHVITSRLKEGTIVNRPVPRRKEPEPGEKPKEKKAPENEPEPGNEPGEKPGPEDYNIGPRAIFICRPDINYVLGSICGPWTIGPDGVTVKPEGCNLPCWFVEKTEKPAGEPAVGEKEKEGKARNAPPVTRSIFVSYYEDSQLVQSTINSPSEEFYKKAKDLDYGEKYTPESATFQSDYGILARIHDEHNNKRIIIAGIHQLGTWVVGHLLSRLFYGENVDGMETFLGDRDFIAIIEGKFFDDQWKVTHEKVYSEYIWTFEDNKWSPVKPGQK